MKYYLNIYFNSFKRGYLFSLFFYCIVLIHALKFHILFYDLFKIKIILQCIILCKIHNMQKQKFLALGT